MNVNGIWSSFLIVHYFGNFGTSCRTVAAHLGLYKATWQSKKWAVILSQAFWWLDIRLVSFWSCLHTMGTRLCVFQICLQFFGACLLCPCWRELPNPDSAAYKASTFSDPWDLLSYPLIVFQVRILYRYMFPLSSISIVLNAFCFKG